MSDVGHTVRSYDDELRALSDRISDMGRLAEKQVLGAVSALVNHDAELAAQVIADDHEMDRMERDAEAAAVDVIARRGPVAIDLREIMASVRIAGILERVGDHAKNIAKRAAAIAPEQPPIRISSSLQSIGRLASSQLNLVLRAYTDRDAAVALEVWRNDGEIDRRYTSLFRELLTYMMEDSRSITPSTHVLFCAKNIERVGDHATNIAEIVHFLVTGDPPEGERPKADESSSAG
jgi:phosphate transport system protein